MFRTLGPGLIAGAADDDPSSISTYAFAGAATGYGLLWIAVVTTPMMAVLMGMSARIGRVTGGGLAAAIRCYVPRALAVPLGALIILANTFNIGADLGGMAGAAHAVIPLPPALFAALFGIIAIAAHTLIPRAAFARAFTALSVALFAFFAVAFTASALVAHPDWPRLLMGALVPHVRADRTWFATVLAVFGTTITPYLFLWQSSQATPHTQGGSPNAREIAAAHADINVGMILANLVALCIIATFATVLGDRPHALTSAEDAAAALRPLAGTFAPALFALAMIGSGLLAIPVLASTSAYAAAELLGTARTPFTLVAGAGIVAGVALAATGTDAIAPLIWSAIVNGLIAVPLITAVVTIASSRRIMREWRSSSLAIAWGWLTVLLVAAASVALVYFSLVPT